MKEQHTESELQAWLAGERAKFQRIDLFMSIGAFIIVAFVFGFGFIFGLISGGFTYYISSNGTNKKLAEMERTTRAQYDFIP